MSVLDTFTVVFKGDSTDLQKSLKGVQQQLDELHKKVNKTQDEKKLVAELEKSYAHLQKRIKESNKETDDLGKGFKRVIENGVAAAASFLGIRAALVKAADIAAFNSDLSVQGKIIGQNTQDIAAYGAAVEAAGGSMDGFRNYIQQATEKAAEAGLKLPPIATFFRNIRKELEGLSDNEKLRRLNLLGITDPGMISLLEASNTEFERAIALAEQHARVTQKDAAAARDFEKSWSSVKTALSAAVTTLETPILPLLTKFLNYWSNMNWFDVLIGRGPKNPSAPPAAPSTSPAPSAPALGGGKQGNAKKSFDFWLAQGYTREQAAGLVANEQRESGFNGGAVGDNGQAKGIFQWHPDRRARILAATGVDIDNAGHEDQLRAAAWELNSTGLGAQLKGKTSPEDAAMFLSRNFERPANGSYEALARAQIARQNYNSLLFSDVSANNQAINSGSLSSFASGGGTVNNGGDKNVNVKIDTLNIQTQATDSDAIAAGISSGLTNRFRELVSNYDDGIKA